MAGPKLQLLLGALLIAASSLAGAQNCGCAKGQSGPCYNSPFSGGGGRVSMADVVTQGFNTKNTFLKAAIQYIGFGDDAAADDSKRETGCEVSVEDVVTQEFFDSIIDQSGASCEGKEFYTRNAFLEAAIQYSGFGNAATADDSKREIAAFFAHVTHETEYFCYIEERDKSISYCDDEFFPQYPCMPGKKYFGRGPLQLSWNYNYGAAGQAIGFDGLNFPEIVSSDVVISFKTALWFWMNNVHDVVNKGFGATIRVINGALECNGGNTPAVNHRVRLYIDYCNQFDVSHGDNLYC